MLVGGGGGGVVNQIQYQIVCHQHGMNYSWVGAVRETRLFWAMELW